MSEMSSSSPPADSPPAEPTYNISDVRAALKKIRAQMASEASSSSLIVDDAALNVSYCSVLTTLSKVVSNVSRLPVNPAHLTINLRNPAVQKKFGALTGARDLMRFCGFVESETAEAHVLAMPAEAVDANRVRIDRALVILNAVRVEHTPVVEEADQPMPEAAFASSVFLANTEEPNSSSLSAADSSPDLPEDEPMKPDLEPTYNIGEVRIALKQLFTEVNSSLPPPAAAVTPFDLSLHALTVRDAYCQVLDTLGKITQNVAKTPVNPQHLRINLANPVVRKKFAQFAGATQYLRFLGFHEPSEEEAAATPPTPTAATAATPTTEQQLLVLTDPALDASSVKLSRALSILTALRTESTVSTAENERRELGPVAREVRVFDLAATVAQPSRSQNANLGAVDEWAEETPADMALVMAANAAERKRVHDMTRTDVIVTKARLAEIKESTKRKYHRTLIKITFTDKVATMAPQGRGRYGTNSTGSLRLGGGYVLGTKKIVDTTPTPTPMEVDDDEEQKGAENNSSSPAPAAAAAAAVASSPPVLPVSPSPPAPELMISAYFRPWETLGDIFAFLQSSLRDESRTTPFYLHLPPNIRFQCGGEDKQGKHAANRTRTLQSLGLVPAASMIFHYCTGADTAAVAPASVIGTLREDLTSRKEAYDFGTLAAMMPAAENKAALEEAKIDTADAKPALPPSDNRNSDDEDGDIEAFMRRKKAAAARAAARPAAAKNNSAASSSGSASSSSAGSAAARRVIPGLFKPK